MFGALKALFGRRGTGISPRVAAKASKHIVEMHRHLGELEVMEGLDRFPETQTVPREFFPTLKRALKAYDGYLETILRESEIEVTCSAGCGACCHDAPSGISGLELLLVYHAQYQRKDFLKLHRRAMDLAELLGEDMQAVSPGAQQMRIGGKEWSTVQMRYRMRKKPCIFLDKRSAKCSIYESRPIACRLHFSVSNPELCWPDHADRETAKLVHYGPPRQVLKQINRIAQRMGLDGLSPILFQGIGEIAGNVMEGEPVYVAGQSRKKQRKHKVG